MRGLFHTGILIATVIVYTKLSQTKYKPENGGGGGGKHVIPKLENFKDFIYELAL